MARFCEVFFVVFIDLMGKFGYALTAHFLNLRIFLSGLSSAPFKRASRKSTIADVIYFQWFSPNSSRFPNEIYQLATVHNSYVPPCLVPNLHRYVPWLFFIFLGLLRGANETWSF